MSRPPAEASSSTAQANEISEWLVSRIKCKDDPTPDTTAGTTQDDKTQNLMQIVVSKRWEDAEEYEPRVVSIGPIHHGKMHLQAMEEKKWSFLREYVQNVETFDITPSFVEVMLRARDHYSHSDHSAYDERAWCMMMFLDTLFICSFIDDDLGRRWPRLDMKNHDRDLVRRDLLLLENQLPFEVLLEFMKNKIIPFDRFSITAFLSIQSMGAVPLFRHLSRIFNESPQPVSHEHLLQLFRGIWINAHDESALRVIDEERASGEYFDYRYVDYPALSVTELKKVGIRCSLGDLYLFPPSDICFIPSKLSGELLLPRLDIHEGTKSLLLNVVAYEYSSGKSDWESLLISSYLNFMAMLIIQEEDVKELRARGIIVNCIGSDQAVVDLFKDINANLVMYHPRAFWRVKYKIFIYLTSKRFRLRVGLAEVKSEFGQRYFRGPWSFLVFLAVLFTVSMTILQTIFTAIQTFK